MNELLTKRIAVPAWVLMSAALVGVIGLQLLSRAGKSQAIQPSTTTVPVTQSTSQEVMGFGISPAAFEANMPQHVKFASHPTIPSIRMATFDNAVITYDFDSKQVIRVTVSHGVPDHELRLMVFLTEMMGSLSGGKNDDGVHAALWMAVARDMRAAERTIVSQLDFVPRNCELVADFDRIRVRSLPPEDKMSHFIIESVGSPRGQLQFSKRK